VEIAAHAPQRLQVESLDRRAPPSPEILLDRWERRIPGELLGHPHRLNRPQSNHLDCNDHQYADLGQKCDGPAVVGPRMLGRSLPRCVLDAEVRRDRIIHGSPRRTRVGGEGAVSPLADLPTNNIENSSCECWRSSFTEPVSGKISRAKKSVVHSQQSHNQRSHCSG